MGMCSFALMLVMTCSIQHLGLGRTGAQHYHRYHQTTEQSRAAAQGAAAEAQGLLIGSWVSMHAQ